MLGEELVQIVESVWQTTVGNAIRFVPSAGAEPVATPALTARISFRGAWPGELAATCSATLARQIAACMFQLPAEDSSDADIRDAIAEVVNILGGNVKAILPPPCQLSLPSVVESSGSDASSPVPGSETVETVCFECGGETLVLRLVREPACATAQ